MLTLNFSNLLLEAGTDEAGRGCLAGPVTAAAVIFKEYSQDDIKTNENLRLFFELIKDSKQISEKNREKICPIIKDIALSFAITHVFEEKIDQINILNAAILAMQESVLRLNPRPNFVIVDGNAPFISKKGFYKDFSLSEKEILNNIPNSSIVKGDSKYLSIAAASIIAKTTRDEYMNEIHEEFPMYNWKKNKGYPTKEHREAIMKYGLTKYHRLSFNCLSPLD